MQDSLFLQLVLSASLAHEAAASEASVGLLMHCNYQLIVCQWEKQKSLINVGQLLSSLNASFGEARGGAMVRRSNKKPDGYLHRSDWQ